MPAAFCDSSLLHVRHRIESALCERPAAPEPLERQQRAAARAMPRNRFARIIRAGGMKLAGAAKERRKKRNVETDEQQQETTRRDRMRAARFRAPGCSAVSELCAAAIFSSSSVSVENSAVDGRAARVNHNVPSRGNLLSVQPQNFAEPAPDAIAPDRGAQRLFDAPAEPADVEAIGAKKNGEFAAGLAASRLVHRVIFRAAHQPAGARKTQPRRVRRA